jgi:hypothetical protein
MRHRRRNPALRICRCNGADDSSMLHFGARSLDTLSAKQDARLPARLKEWT